MKKYDGERAVISLTSWKARIDTVHKTIENLLTTCPGFHVCLTLSLEEFPNGVFSLPRSLTDLEKANKIQILWYKENIKTFKKILPALAEFNVPVISADDDCIYTENYAQRLYDAWKSFDCIHQIYSYHVDQFCWPYRFGNGPAVLYPPHCFSTFGLRCLSKEIRETGHDDLYYGALAFQMRIPIVEISKNRPYVFHDEIDPEENRRGDGILCLRTILNSLNRN